MPESVPSSAQHQPPIPMLEARGELIRQLQAAQRHAQVAVQIADVLADANQMPSRLPRRLRTMKALLEQLVMITATVQPS